MERLPRQGGKRDRVTEEIMRRDEKEIIWRGERD